MHDIGTIIRTQIQQSPLKSGEGVNRVYRTAPLLPVEKLILTPEGITGITAAGERLLDAHNMRHPQSRNKNGANGISFGFVHHYDTMRARFGDHLTYGSAGENILVRAYDSTTLPDITTGKLAIRSAADNTLIELVDIVPAPPCEPFSRFCAGFRPEAAEMKAILQFLDEGRRGYYASLAARQGLFDVQAGDVLVKL